MSGILDLLNSDIGRQMISGLSKETQQPEDKTSQLLSMALPLIMGAINRNANNSQGASGLMNALNQKHDGSILDNLGGFFEGGVSQNQKDDGMGILGHVFGGSKNNVVNALSQKSGVDSDSVMQMLQVVAPLVLGYLGKQKNSNNIQSTDGLSSLIGGMMGSNGSNKNQQSMIESILDGNNDGSILDDVAGMVLGGNKNKGGLGGLLGGLFGGK